MILKLFFKKIEILLQNTGLKEKKQGVLRYLLSTEHSLKKKQTEIKHNTTVQQKRTINKQTTTINFFQKLKKIFNTKPNGI